MIAAIVRFADELDIDSSRVSLDIVKLFSIPNENALYWYLHSMTHLDTTNNNIRLTIGLNPKDYKRFGNIVKEEVIEKLKSKNIDTMQILNEFNFSVAIVSSSQVVEDSNIPELPEEIKNELTIQTNARRVLEKRSKADDSEAVKPETEESLLKIIDQTFEEIMEIINAMTENDPDLFATFQEIKLAHPRERKALEAVSLMNAILEKLMP